MTKGFDHVFRLAAAKEAVLDGARLYASGYRDGSISEDAQERGHTAIVRGVKALEQLEAEFEQEDYFLRWDVAEDKERDEPK